MGAGDRNEHEADIFSQDVNNIFESVIRALADGGDNGKETTEAEREQNHSY